MNTMIRIYIVEDEPDIREGLAVLINGSEGFTCTGTSGSAEDALTGIGNTRPDIVLMDINLPGMNGIECIVQLKQKYPEIQVMMLTVFDNSEEIFRSLTAGATGYLLKKTPPARLLEALRELAAGESPMSGEIARKVVNAFQQTTRPPAQDADLTAREKEILALLAKGYLYKEIAALLFISLDTVRTHIRKIYQKLQVRTRSEVLIKVMGRKPF